MPLPLIIMLAICGIIVFVGIPMGMLYQQWQNKKKADGSHIAALILDRTGTSGRFELLPKDREIVTDAIKNTNNPEGLPITYLASEGYTPSILWPPFRSKFFQVSMPLGIWIEGVDTPVDSLKEYRNSTKLRKVDSSHLWAHQRAEKLTKTVVEDADTYNELLEQLKKNSRGTSLFMVLLGLGTIIAVIVVAVILNGKLGGIAQQLTDLTTALIGPATPAVP